VERLFAPLDPESLTADEQQALAAARAGGQVRDATVTDARLDSWARLDPGAAADRLAADFLTVPAGSRLSVRTAGFHRRGGPADSEHGAACGAPPSTILESSEYQSADTTSMSFPPRPFLPSTRREFLRASGRGIGLLAFSRFAPAFLVRSALGGAPPPERTGASW